MVFIDNWQNDFESKITAEKLEIENNSQQLQDYYPPCDDILPQEELLNLISKQDKTSS